MLSVLIPIYNFNAFNLVQNLVQQLDQLALNFEIICLDDASDERFHQDNEEIEKLNNCSFHLLDVNIGRSKIRNLLAKKANYEWLLFLDSDVFPKHLDFLKGYQDFLIQKKIQIICGGISYSKERPAKTKRLRWKYGMYREQRSLESRKNNPYAYFYSANFLIMRSIFSSVKFDESIVQYGHEDTLFAKNLKSNDIVIEHIENPVNHLGIDHTGDFLHKTQQSITNAHTLYRSGKLTEEDLKLQKKYNQLLKKKQLSLFNFAYKLLSKVIELNLQSRSPSLIFFDFYRLKYLIDLNRLKR